MSITAVCKNVPVEKGIGAHCQSTSCEQRDVAVLEEWCTGYRAARTIPLAARCARWVVAFERLALIWGLQQAYNVSHWSNHVDCNPPLEGVSTLYAKWRDGLHSGSKGREAQRGDVLHSMRLRCSVYNGHGQKHVSIPRHLQRNTRGLGAFELSALGFAPVGAPCEAWEGRATFAVEARLSAWTGHTHVFLASRFLRDRNELHLRSTARSLHVLP